MNISLGRTVGASALALALFATSAFAADYTVELSAASDEGVPAEYTMMQWMEARGEVRAVEDGDKHEITFEASNLIADGLYTFWWVNPGVVRMDMGPAGGVPDNEFRADSDGNAEVTFEVSADNDYQRIVVVYHADDETHGEEPGEMGVVSFEHLAGAWPGPDGVEEM